MQKVSLEGPNDVLHPVDAHRRPVENIAGGLKRQKKKNSLSSQSETFRLLVQRRLELKENKKKWFLHLSSCKKISKQEN